MKRDNSPAFAGAQRKTAVGPREEFSLLMMRVQEGSEDAVKEFLDKYGRPIYRVVRRHLSKRLRAKYDSSDFVQSVWASFFALPTRGQAFQTPEALTAYLANMARHKVADVHRQRLGAAKYDVNRERSLDGSAALQFEGVAAKQATPSQIVGAKEQWDRLVENLPTHQKIILELLRQGYTRLEIADKFGFDEKTVRRLIRRIAPELLPDDADKAAGSI